jgi:hypothetical protein
MRRKRTQARIPQPAGLRLLGLLLFLLADADFEHLVFAFLKSLMIVARDSVLKVRIDVHVLGQDRHQSVIFVAGRAKGPKALDIRNCHRFLE